MFWLTISGINIFGKHISANFELWFLMEMFDDDLYML